MNSKHIFSSAALFAVALLVALPARPIGEILRDTAVEGTFLEQLEALRTGNPVENDILVQGDTPGGNKTIYLVDMPIVVDDTEWPDGVLVISGDPDNQPHEVILSGTGQEEPAAWSFPLYPDGDTSLPAAGCVSIEVIREVDAATSDITYDVTFDVSYDDTVLTDTPTSLDVLDASDILQNSFVPADSDTGNFDSPFTVHWMNIPEAQGTALLAQDGSSKLRFNSTTDDLEGEVLDLFCSRDDRGGQTPPTATGAMFEVEEGGTLILQNITLNAENVGIRVAPGGRVELNQVYLRDSGGAAVEFMADSGALTATGEFLNCSIVRNGTDGIVISGGAVTIQQCSFLDNEGAGIRILDQDVTATIAASLFHNNDYGIFGADEADPDAADAPAPTVDACWFIKHGSEDYTDDIGDLIINEFFTEDLVQTVYAGATDDDVGTNLPVFEKGSWRGKLSLLILPQAINKEADPDEPLTVADLPLANTVDFEDELRGSADDDIVFIGADDPTGIAAVAGTWFDCDIITPRISLNGRAVAASGDPVIARIETEGVNLSGATVTVVHSSGTFGSTILGSYSVNTGSVTSNYGSVFFNVPIGATLFDGLAQLVLTADGLDYPDLLGTYPNHPTPADPAVSTAAEIGRYFIIDTSPPIAADCGVPMLFSSNDAMAPAAGPFPADWAGTNMVPRSQGSMIDPNRDPQFFFNLDNSPANIATPPTPLAFTINVCFVDQGIGFISDYPTITGVGGGTGAGSIYEALTNPYGDPSAPPAGTVWWDGNEPSVASLLANQPLGPGATVQISSQSFTSGGFSGVQMTYAFTGLEYVSTNWHLIASFVAADAGGNIGNIEREAHFWWYPNDPWIFGTPVTAWAGYRDTGATLTADPGGNATSDPVITWDIDRASAPVDAYPAFPIARFRVRRIDGPGVQTLLGISPWIREHTVDRYTIIDNSVNPPIRLGTLLDAPINLGKRIAIDFVAADEAGNEEFFVAAPGFNPAATSFINEGQGAALETSIHPRYWHNSTINPNILDIEAQGGEIDFGSSSRIPLPTDPRYRVEAGFEVTAGATGAQAGQVSIDWELFEGGVLVAQGNMIPNRNNKRATLRVPAEIIDSTIDPDASKQLTVTVVQLFLNASPSGAAVDRLGDEGPEPTFRQRDIEYTFTARTRLETLDSVIRDTSPASVSFTVYADRDVGGTDPVKNFVRE